MSNLGPKAKYKPSTILQIDKQVETIFRSMFWPRQLPKTPMLALVKIVPYLIKRKHPLAIPICVNKLKNVILKPNYYNLSTATLCIKDMYNIWIIK